MQTEPYLPYREHLKIIRRELEHELSRFPINRCMESCWITYFLLPLGVKAGYFWDNETKTPHFHVWNHDPIRSLDICLTLDQFDNPERKMQPITITPSNRSIFVQDEFAEELVHKVNPFKDKKYRKWLLEKAKRISEKLPLARFPSSHSQVSPLFDIPTKVPPYKNKPQ